MRKHSLLLTAIFVLLITIIIVFRERSPFGSRNSDFAIDWTEEIRSIEIIEEDISLELTRAGDRWMVNETFAARSSAIDFIMQTIENIEIKSPVSDALFDELINKNNIRATELIIRGKSKSDSYYIYPSHDSAYPSIMRRSLKSKPFFVTIPAYDFDPGRHFVTDEKFWMPFHIFKLNPAVISRITVSYRDPAIEDFLIAVEEENIYLQVEGNKISEAKPEKLQRYISYFTYVPFETWAFDMDESLRNELLSTEPEINIELELGNGNTLNTRLWNKLLGTEEGTIPDTDRLYGTLNGGRDFFIAKYFDLDPLIKTAEYFISD